MQCLAPACSLARTSRRIRNEKNVPAWPPKARPYSRFPCPHEDQGWSPRHQGAPRSRSAAIDSLTESAGGDEAASRTARFRPEQRLRASADFASLFKSGQRYSDPRFVIYYRPNTLTAARLGLAVSKRVARKATRRNQLKRLLRETFRTLTESLPALDLVVLLRPDAASADGQMLRASLVRAFEVITRSPRRRHGAARN